MGENIYEQFFSRFVAMHVNSRIERNTVARIRLEKTLELEEHYENFKPVLDCIMKTAEDDKRASEFFVEDSFSFLPTIPGNSALRDTYIRYIINKDISNNGIESSNTFAEDFLKYKKVIKIFDKEDSFQKVNELRDYIFENTPTNIFDHSRVYLDKKSLLSSRAYGDAVDRLTECLQNITESNLEIICTFCEEHEELALVVTEPLLCAVLGNGLMLALILPLHKSGYFSGLMGHTRAKLERLRYENSLRMRTWVACSSLIEKISIQLRRKPLLTASIGLGSFYSLGLFKYTPFLKNKVGLVQILADKALTGEGFNNPTLDLVKSNLTKLSFEVGQLLSTLTQSFTQGFLSKYTETLKELAPYIDKFVKESFPGKKAR